MTSNRTRWISALGLGLVVAAATPESLFPGARLLAFVLGVVAVRTILHFTLGPTSTVERETLHDRRSADGHVGFALILGVLAEPNPIDPRVGRYLGFVPRASPREKARHVGRERCPPLLGKIVIVSVFIGRDGRSWSDKEIAAVHTAIERAGEWIEREAIRWDARTNVAVASTYFLTRDNDDDPVDLELQYEGGALEAFEKGQERKALESLTRAAVSCGFEHAREWVDFVEGGLHDADVVVWLLHPRRAGRSFAIPVDLAISEPVHLAVCYPSFADLPAPVVGKSVGDPVTIAHELFHLFGASDKYRQPLRTFPPGMVGPHDIMRLGVNRLSRLTVDRATAGEVGWLIRSDGFEKQSGRLA